MVCFKNQTIKIVILSQYKEIVCFLELKKQDKKALIGYFFRFSNISGKTYKKTGLLTIR